MTKQPFTLNQGTGQMLTDQNGTPVYVYSLEYLEGRAKELLDLCQKHGFLARYAVKANPHTKIIQLFDKAGLHFDASSEFEAQRLLKNGVTPNKISLSSQQPPTDMAKTLQSGVNFVATSLHQLDLVKESGWRGTLGVRLNPGLGSGHNNRTNTGGITSSFGIWHEYTPEVLDWQKTRGCNINKIHIHIGSGGDPSIWREAIKRSLELVEQIPSIEILNMGGGFKVARMPDEPEVNMTEILGVFAEELEKFQKSTNRNIKLEIEPGNWLVANSGVLLAKIVDITDTGKNGFMFLKLNTGMNDLLRPAMYGAQHPIEILNNSKGEQEYVVVGHNCETGDILTPAPGDPEAIEPRLLNKASIGDLVTIGGAGAYGTSMRASGYNDFPPAKEVFI